MILMKKSAINFSIPWNVSLFFHENEKTRFIGLYQEFGVIKCNNVIFQHLRLVFYDFLSHLRAILSNPIAAINQRWTSCF